MYSCARSFSCIYPCLYGTYRMLFTLYIIYVMGSTTAVMATGFNAFKGGLDKFMQERSTKGH